MPKDTSVEAQIAEVSETLAVMRSNLSETMSDLRRRGDLVKATVRHGRRTTRETRQNPSMRRARSLEALIRALERRLKMLRAQEKEFADATRVASGRFAQFAVPEREKNE